MKRLEKLPDTELIKLTMEHKQAILENNNFLDNFEQHFDNFKECYFLLKKKVKEINEFFYSNFKIELREVGFFSKYNERHLVFSNNTKNEYLKKFEEINNIYLQLLSLNSKFLYIPSTKYISDDLFQSDHKKEYHHTYHLFDFEIDLSGDDDFKKPRTRHDGQKLPGVGIFELHYLGNFKSFSESFPLKELVKTTELPRVIAEKKVYENELKNINEDKNKILRKIELILRARKKRKEKIENVGYVYVFSNKSLPPNTYKIGSTYGLPEERAEQLSGTGHLTPFKVVDEIKIQSAEYYEKSIHKLLNKYRVGKEYFELELDKIKDCLQQVSILSEKGQKKVSLADLRNKIKIK